MKIRKSFIPGFKLYILLCLFTAIFPSKIYSNSDSTEMAPGINAHFEPYLKYQDNILFSNSRAFGFDAFLGTFGPCKWFLNSPENITSIVNQQGDFFAGGSWANGQWYAITYTAHNFLRCDTTSGANTVIGNLGSISGNTVALCWDPTSSIMYMLTNGPPNLYTVNLNTGAATLVNPISGVTSIIDGAVSNGGILYGIELNGSGNLGIINKTTGVWTTVGPLGIIPSHAQGSAFDRNTNIYYWAAYTVFGLSTLRTINLQTGASSIIGQFQYNAEIDGFVIPYTNFTQQAHEIVTGPLLSLPNLFLINNTYSIKTQVQNAGTSNESNVPVRWFVNGNIINTSNINLNSGQVDSVSNSWTPSTPGIYNLKYVSALLNDTVHVDDTIQTMVTVYSSIPSLCEGFNRLAFPPPGWTVGGSGQGFWYRQTYSGFGLGSGCAVYDMWNAPPNNNGALWTSVFQATGNADTLFFDIAYCPFSNYQDSLLILVSTNGGSSYIDLVRMGPSDMATVGSCSHPFYPTASQWGTRRFVLPPGTNKLDFLGKSQYGEAVYLDSICIKQGPTGIKISNNIPFQFALYQNYPNPFNPATRIKFDIPNSQLTTDNVQLIIYDLLGREIATLVHEKLKPGIYEVGWNASNFPSGVYLYKLNVGDYSETKRMVLIK